MRDLEKILDEHNVQLDSDGKIYVEGNNVKSGADYFILESDDHLMTDVFEAIREMDNNHE